ncbi:MAG: type III polyketide synthase [Ferruginibacter sp.]
MSKIISIATKVPEYKYEQQCLYNFADKIYSQDAVESRKLRFLYNFSGIENRYSVLPDFNLAQNKRLMFSDSEDLEPHPTLEKRMEIFKTSAANLACEAIETCIINKIPIEKITHLITVSCTGMSAPGIDLQIIEKLKLPRETIRLSVNFMGCYAAVHGLKIADAFCKADKDANVIVVCTELCTIHFQKEITPDNITSSLLFGDGCAAVLVNNSNEIGINLDSFYSEISQDGEKDMAWQLSGSGFLMTLSGYVPELINQDFKKICTRALNKTSKQIENVTHWCIHPGGKKIIEAIEKSLSKSKEDFKYSYEVLKDYGNMSSPTILFVLEKIFNELKEKNNEQALIFAAAFGPGLTTETFTASYD